MLTTEIALALVAFGLLLIGIGLWRRPRFAVATRAAALHALVVLTLAGCASVLPALIAASQGAQWLGTVLDVAEAGADAFLARHPHQATEEQIDHAVRKARAALSALDAALAVAEAVGDEDVARARHEAVVAYGELRKLLDELGVLSGRAPAGGAETDAPLPEPVELPSAELIEARLR